MDESVRILEEIILNGSASSENEAVMQVLNKTTEWLSLKDKTRLYKLAKTQYKSGLVLKLFKEVENNENE